MYVNTEHFLSDTASVKMERDGKDYWISIVDGSFFCHLYMSKREAKALGAKFETLTSHTCFFAGDVAIFSKFENDLLATLRTKLEGI